MKHFITMLGAAACVVVLGAMPPSEGSIALVSKVILDVTKKPVGKEWLPARRGEMLSSGERVKTGERSVAVIKFKDNSMVRVREKTEVLLGGDMQGKSFFKTTELEKGVIGFSIKKQQQGEEFRFSSPTSVASIRGTAGLFSASDSSDKVIVIEGLVRFTNKISSDGLDVQGGQTGISTRDGKIQVRSSTQEERLAAQLAARTGEQENRLDIELNNNDGSKKNIEIRFR
jgi:hypothetical protein